MAVTTPKKTTGSGTKLSISSDGSQYTEFASVKSITPPSMSRGTVEVTDMNSYYNNDQFKEYLGDFIDGDEMSISGYLLKTDEALAAAETAFYGGSEIYIKIDLPAVIGQSMTVKGIVTKYQRVGDISVSDGLAFSMSIKPTAKPIMAATSSS